MSTVDQELGQARPFDPYALTPEGVEAPPRRLGPALRQIGPGLILAGAIVGTGELIATTHLGAKVGFSLLWLVIVSCFIKVFVQAELGRYSIASGKTTLAAFRELPGPLRHFGWWWLIMMLCTHLQLAAIVGGVGQAIHMALPGAFGHLSQPALPWAILAALATSVLLAVGGYAAVEKGSTVLVATFTLITVLCVALLPVAGHPIPWGQVAGGLEFSLPKDAAALAAALAMFGITGVGATELVQYPYWCIEKGYARKTGPPDGSELRARHAQGWLRIMKLDAFLSMGVYTLATLAFYFLGAAVLHGQGASGLPGSVDAMLTTLSRMYEPVMGARWATVFIVVGVFTVLYSTLYSAVAGHARTMADFLRTNCGLSFAGPADRQRWVRFFCLALPLFDLALFLAFENPVQMVQIGGITQALTLPMIAAAAIYLRYKRTDHRLTPGRLWDLFLWLSLTGLCLAATYGLIDALTKLAKR